MSDTPVPTGAEQVPSTLSPDPTPPAPAELGQPEGLTEGIAEPTPTETPTEPQYKDWATRRTEYAKGDEKLLKRLSRYASEEAVVDALIAAQNKIASGTLKSALPENPTPEELSQWRAENGVPDSPEGYDVSTLPDGLIVGDTDKPIVDGYLKVAHDMNLDPKVVQSTVQYFLQEQERQVAERQAADEELRVQSTIQLKQEMGSEFETNKNLIRNMLAGAPEGLADIILGARAGDGSPIASNPTMFRWLANMAREINPVATVVPGSGNNAAQAVESEIAALNKMMGDRNSEYWKGPNSAKNQARWRELNEFQRKTASR